MCQPTTQPKVHFPADSSASTTEEFFKSSPQNELVSRMKMMTLASIKPTLSSGDISNLKIQIPPMATQNQNQTTCPTGSQTAPITKSSNLLPPAPLQRSKSADLSATRSPRLVRWFMEPLQRPYSQRELNLVAPTSL